MKFIQFFQSTAHAVSTLCGQVAQCGFNYGKCCWLILPVARSATGRRAWAWGLCGALRLYVPVVRPFWQNNCFIFHSCSRDILLACSPICTSKMAPKPANLRFSADFHAPSASQTLQNSKFDRFLRHQSACRPIENRGSSYLMHSGYFAVEGWLPCCWPPTRRLTAQDRRRKVSQYATA
jgi:hypothetical protein